MRRPDAVHRAARAVDDLEVVEYSPHGQAGVWMARTLFRLLRPYALRARTVSRAVVGALEEMSQAIDALSASVDSLRTRVEATEESLNNIHRWYAPGTAWLLPRIVADAGAAGVTPIVIPAPVPASRVPPPNCVRVATDEGDMWAIAHDRVMTPTLRETHTWEPEFTAVLATLVRPRMTAIDVGANIGYVTRTLARLTGPGGRVIALEPEPVNFELLCANVADISDVDVYCVPAAAAERTRTVTLWLGDENLGDNRTWRPSDSHARSVRVPGVRLDDLVHESVVVDVVKVDTQGTDHVVVQGMERLIERCRPTLLVEFWLEGLEGLGTRADDVLTYYRRLGFSVALVSEPENRSIGNDEIIERTQSHRGGYVDLVLAPA